MREYFISDLHLGTKGCNDEDLLYFLKTVPRAGDRLYIVGDGIDLWKLATMADWPALHSQAVKELFDMAAGGTEITYIIGNHDDWLVNLMANYGPFRIVTEIERGGFAILHGHQFDDRIKYLGLFARLLTGLADLFRKDAQSRFSMAEYLKKRPDANDAFIKEAAGHAKKNKCRGIICGHTHKPGLCRVDGIIYANCGDFVENSTYIIKEAGELQLWGQDRENRQLVAWEKTK